MKAVQFTGDGRKPIRAADTSLRPVIGDTPGLVQRLTALPLKLRIPNRTVADRGRGGSDQEDTAANKMSSPIVPRMIEGHR